MYQGNDNYPNGRYPDLISLQPPRNGFNYGQSYIFKTTFEITSKYQIWGKYFLLVEDHHKVIINDNMLSTQYGTLYYARHSSKRKSYDFGVHEIDLSLFLKNGINELIIWNNLSSNVHTTGVGVKLEIKIDKEPQIIFKSNDLNWEIYTGITDGDILKEETLLDYELKVKI